MHALVVERVVGVAEELLVGLALIERRVVLAGHEADVGHLELLDDVAELGEALAALLAVVGGVGQVAGEDDEIGLLAERVDPRDRLLERVRGVRVGLRAGEAPMGVGQLDEVEILLRARSGGARAIAEAGGEHDASEAGELQEFLAAERGHRGLLMMGWRRGSPSAMTAGRAGLFPASWENLGAGNKPGLSSVLHPGYGRKKGIRGGDGAGAPQAIRADRAAASRRGL